MVCNRQKKDYLLPFAEKNVTLAKVYLIKLFLHSFSAVLFQNKMDTCLLL